MKRTFVCEMNEQGYFTDEFTSLVTRIVLDDRQQYKKYNDDYYQNPMDEIKRAVEELQNSNEWHDNWNKFVNTMVFAEKKPTYAEVLKNLHNKTQLALAELKK